MLKLPDKDPLPVNELARALDKNVATIYRWGSPRGVRGHRLPPDPHRRSHRGGAMQLGFVLERAEQRVSSPVQRFAQLTEPTGKQCRRRTRCCRILVRSNTTKEIATYPNKKTHRCLARQSCCNDGCTGGEIRPQLCLPL